MGVSSRYCYKTHVTLSQTIIMGTKLSKTDNKQQVKDDVQEPTPEEKSMTLPASPETSKTEEDVVDEEANITAKSETLPGSSLDRTSSFSNRLRKSMRKMVGRKKVKESKKEEADEAENQDTNTTEQKEEEKEDDFKTVQQKARADFFKDMIPENSKSTDKDDPEKEAEKEGKITENDDAAEETVNVSLIGSPVPEEPEKTSTDEVTEKEEITEQPEKEETKQVSAVSQDKQEVEKESSYVAERDTTNDLEDVQDEATTEEKLEEVSENKDESKELEPVT